MTRLERLRTRHSCVVVILLFLLQISVLCAAGEVKKPSFERIRQWAEKAEEIEAGKRIDASREKLVKEIAKARAELGKYLAAKPDDVEALLLAARIGRAEIMISPIELIGPEMLQHLQQMEPKRRQRVDELANYCDRALAVQHDSGEAYYWKARLFGIRHFGIRSERMVWVYVDLNLAAQFARKAVDLDSNNLRYREALAKYLFLSQRLDEATGVMREAAGGQHPMYVLLSDMKHLPLPERAVLLREDTENRVQDSIDARWKRDYRELRISQYVIPMRAQEVEDFYRRTWPDFRFFKIKSEEVGDIHLDSSVQLLFSRDTGFVPAGKKEDVPDSPSEGLFLNLGEVHRQKKRNPPYPIPVGDPYCLLTVTNYRPTRQP